jgi:hypothetical protein
VGTEYVIMEHVSGIPLKNMWSRMTEVQHIELIGSMGKLFEELCTLEFGSFGSLYLNAADKPPGMRSIASVRTVADNSGFITTIRRPKPQPQWVSKVHVSFEPTPSFHIHIS